MSAIAHNFERSLPSCDGAGLAAKWGVIHEAARAVGALAQLAEEPPSDLVVSLPRRAAALDAQKFGLIERMVDDIDAVMQPGIEVLLAPEIANRGSVDAALSLWCEFRNARDAVLALVPVE